MGYTAAATRVPVARSQGSGRSPTFYVGSIPTGAVYRGDLGTGAGSVLVPATAGRAAIVHQLARARGARRAAARRPGAPHRAHGRLPADRRPTANNLNGIAFAGHRTLVLVQSNTGKLFTADARTGATHEIDLRGATVVNGDGILLIGRVLFVVQNRLNQIAVVDLSRDLSRGKLVHTITDPHFDVPTTIAAHRGHLYAINARFGTTDPQPAAYDIVRVP